MSFASSSKRFKQPTRGLARALIFLSALGALGWLWWSATRRGEINFLPRWAPAEWIVYPSTPAGVMHPRLILDTVFRDAFLLDKAPAQAAARVAGFHRYSLTINGVVMDQPVRRGRNWKDPDLFDVSRALRAGTNQIAVRVFNSNGPPALWFSLEVGGRTLNSGEGWAAAGAGASWRPARAATESAAALPGSPLYDNEQPADLWQPSWLVLLIFTMLSAAAYWLITRPRQPPRETNDRSSRAALAIIGLAVAWAALFVNNLGAMPKLFGYDAPAHMDYVGYILEHKSLPLAGDGWEMFQPPLYYLICAGLLKLFSLSVSQAGGVMLLRALGLGIGVAHFVLVWASLRLLFPGAPRRAEWGLVLAACLPPVLYMSQYITNEGLSAALVSACVYLTLRLSKQERVSWPACAGLGLCLGAALLTKFTALLLMPLIFGALLWRWLEKRQMGLGQWVARIGLALAVCLLVCGWHYARVWRRYGNPMIGNWDPGIGMPWWQDPGYRSSAFYLRFGHALFHPWFGALWSFGDGIYSTLWGDGMFGGTALFSYRPPWNYGLMRAGYWLALAPGCAVAAGGVMALRNFMRQPTAEWFLALGLAFLASLAVVQMSLAVPCWFQVKAFYALGALVPFCAFGAWGLEALSRRSATLRAVVCVIFGVWAINSFASFWIARSSLSALLAQGNSLRDEGRGAEAIRLLQGRLVADPQNTPVRALLADTLTRVGDWQEAAQQAALVLKDQPNNASAHLSLALVLQHQERFPEAAEHLRRAVELAPGDAEAYQRLAALCLQQGRLDEAVQVARDGLGIDRFRPELYLALGSALAAGGNDAEAVSQLEMAARFDTTRVEPQALLGVILARQGRLDEAVVRYSNAISLEANNPVLRSDLGKLLARQGKFEDAVAAVTKARALAVANGQKELAEKNQRLIELFSARQIYREPADADTKQAAPAPH